MNEQEIMAEVEDYGRQIFEAISYANEFPVVKEKLPSFSQKTRPLLFCR